MKTKMNEGSSKEEQRAQALAGADLESALKLRKWRRIGKVALVLLGAFSLIGLATGCASMQGSSEAPASADNGGFRYNPEFDYRDPGAADRF